MKVGAAGVVDGNRPDRSARLRVILSSDVSGCGTIGDCSAVESSIRLSMGAGEGVNKGKWID